MTPGVPPRLPLASQRLVVVTGKGGVGKTTVTAALAHAATAGGRRVLAGEVGRGPLGSLLGGARDRKSTRLNSRHGYNSYGGFFLEKKRNEYSVRLGFLRVLPVIPVTST